MANREQFSFKYQIDTSQQIIDFFRAAKSKKEAVGISSASANAYDDLVLLDLLTKQKAKKFGRLKNDVYEANSFKVFKIDLAPTQTGDEFFIDKQLALKWLPRAIAVYDFEGTLGKASLSVYEDFGAVENGIAKTEVTLAARDGKALKAESKLPPGTDLKSRKNQENPALKPTQSSNDVQKQKTNLPETRQLPDQEQVLMPKQPPKLEQEPTVLANKEKGVLRLIESSLESNQAQIESNELHSWNPFDHLANRVTGNEWWNPLNHREDSSGLGKLSSPLKAENEKLLNLKARLERKEITAEAALSEFKVLSKQTSEATSLVSKQVASGAELGAQVTKLTRNTAAVTAGVVAAVVAAPFLVSAGGAFATGAGLSGAGAWLTTGGLTTVGSGLIGGGTAASSGLLMNASASLAYDETSRQSYRNTFGEDFGITSDLGNDFKGGFQGGALAGGNVFLAQNFATYATSFGLSQKTAQMLGASGAAFTTSSVGESLDWLSGASPPKSFQQRLTSVGLNSLAAGLGTSPIGQSLYGDLTIGLTTAGLDAYSSTRGGREEEFWQTWLLQVPTETAFALLGQRMNTAGKLAAGDPRATAKYFEDSALPGWLPGRRNLLELDNNYFFEAGENLKSKTAGLNLKNPLAKSKGKAQASSSSVNNKVVKPVVPLEPSQVAELKTSIESSLASLNDGGAQRFEFQVATVKLRLGDDGNFHYEIIWRDGLNPSLGMVPPGHKLLLRDGLELETPNLNANQQAHFQARKIAIEASKQQIQEALQSLGEQPVELSLEDGTLRLYLMNDGSVHYDVRLNDGRAHTGRAEPGQIIEVQNGLEVLVPTLNAQTQSKIAQRSQSVQSPFAEKVNALLEMGGGSIEIGRGVDVDVRLADPANTVSRRHARLTLKDGQFYLEDISSNGTLVNGQPIPRGGILLEPGSVVEIGSHKLIFDPTVPAYDPFKARQELHLNIKQAIKTDQELNSNQTLEVLNSIKSIPNELSDYKHPELKMPSDFAPGGHYDLTEAELVGIDPQGTLFYRAKDDSGEEDVYQVPFAKIEKLMELNPSYNQKLKEAFLALKPAGAKTQFINNDLLQHNYAAEPRLDLGAGRLIQLSNGAKATIKGLKMDGGKLVVEVQEFGKSRVHSLSPQALLMLKPDLIPVNTPLLIRRSNGDVEVWRVAGYNRETGKVIVLDDQGGNFRTKVKELTAEEALEFAGSLFEKDRILTDNPKFIPALLKSKKVLVFNGAVNEGEGKVTGLNRDGTKLIVTLGNRQLEVEPAEIVVHNRDKLFGEPNLRYQQLQGADGSTTIEHAFESGSQRIINVRKEPNGDINYEFDPNFQPVRTPSHKYQLFVRGQSIEVILPSNVPRSQQLMILSDLNNMYLTIGDAWIGSTKKIVFDPGTNAWDDYWKVAYNNPLHVSAATGGNGTITFYLGTNNFNAGNFWHEFAHNFATQKWGQVAPPDGHPDRAAWEQAQAMEGQSISDYASLKFDADGKKINNLAEFIAEGVRVYAENRAKGNGLWREWRKTHPLTVRLVDPLFVNK